MTWAALLLALLPQAPPDRCNIDHGPWMWPAYPTVVQQSYGQAVEKAQANSSQAIHLGLDVRGAPGSSVYAPFDATVEKIVKPLGAAYKTEIVLAPKEGSGWRARLLHLTDLTVNEGQSVLRGLKVGEVAYWPGKSGKEHVHLEVYVPADKDTSALANPLAFLFSRSDGIRPRFHDIVDANGQVNHGVVFTKHNEGLEEDLEALPFPLPQGEVDIVASVTDFVSPGPVLMSHLLPQAPARVSVSIWKMPSPPLDHFGLYWGPTDVYSNTIDLRNEVPAATIIYRKSSTASPTFNLADYHFVLTNKLSDLTYGSWQTNGPGLYTMLVTAEDLAGNASYVSMWFQVK